MFRSNLLALAVLGSACAPSADLRRPRPAPPAAALDARAELASLAASQVEDVWVAVLDSGVSPLPGSPVRLVDGYDFVDRDRDARDPAGAGSGTELAVSITQTASAALDGAELVEIMPVRVLDESGQVSGSTLARAISWAVDEGVDLIVLPAVGAVDTPAVEAALEQAEHAEVVVVFAPEHSRAEDDEEREREPRMVGPQLAGLAAAFIAVGLVAEEVRAMVDALLDDIHDDEDGDYRDDRGWVEDEPSALIDD